ncbi:MAG: tetratricopeptide repeat protein [Candidatus Kapabacteria bacterium]|nr:tetratricopeptide repeat protein [Candidatus Kapabacteria bacterium]
MRFEDLTTKYLDGDITEPELNEFNVLIDSSPVLKTDFNFLCAIETGLGQMKTQLGSEELAFINSFGSKMFDSFATKPFAIPPDIGGRSIVSVKFLSMIGALIVGSFAGVYYFMNHSSGNEAIKTSIIVNEAKPQSKTQAVILSQSEISSNNEIPVNNKPKFSKSKNNQSFAVIPSVNQDPNSGIVIKDINEVSVQSKDKVTTKNEDLIIKYTNELDLALKTNSKLKQAFCMKKLGILYRDSKISKLKAQEYLGSAADIFEKLGDKENYAETFGELGINDFKSGNNQDAISKLSKSIDILKSINSSKINRWQNELEQVNSRK